MRRDDPRPTGAVLLYDIAGPCLAAADRHSFQPWTRHFGTLAMAYHASGSANPATPYGPEVIRAAVVWAQSMLPEPGKHRGPKEERPRHVELRDTDEHLGAMRHLSDDELATLTPSHSRTLSPRWTSSGSCVWPQRATFAVIDPTWNCLLYTSPSPRDA